MADPIAENLPPYFLPRCLAAAATTPAHEPDWADYPIITDHQTVIETARPQSNVRLGLSATTMSGTFTDDWDSGDDVDRWANLHTGGSAGFGVGIFWSSSFILALLYDAIGNESRLRVAGTGLPVVGIANFKVLPSAIAGAGVNDFTGTFNFLGITVPFVALAIGSPITTASITVTIL